MLSYHYRHSTNSQQLENKTKKRNIVEEALNRTNITSNLVTLVKNMINVLSNTMILLQNWMILKTLNYPLLTHIIYLE